MEKSFNYRLNAMGWMVFVVLTVAAFFDGGIFKSLVILVIFPILIFMSALIQELGRPPQKRAKKIEVKYEEDYYDW